MTLRWPPDRFVRTPAKLGQFIKERRLALDLSQEYLAERLGISRPTYRKMENDQRGPTLSETERLAEEFDMTLADLQARKAPRCAALVEKPVRKRKTPKMRAPKRDIEKFRQVLLYVLTQVAGRPNVGETTLHKLLYFIDFDYYEKFDESLTGVTYIRNHHGPTAVDLREILQQMQKRGDVEAVKIKYCGYPQKKHLALAPPDLSALSAREIKHVDEVLVRLAGKSARDIETYSHGDLPWQAAKPGQAIDYEAVFYRDEPYSMRSYDDEL